MLISYTPRLTQAGRARAWQEFEDLSREIAEAHVYTIKAGGVPKKIHAMSGRLECWGDKWLMLKVPNAVIRGCFDAMNVPGAELPLGEDGRLNAHISVMRPEELAKVGGPGKVNEIGHRFTYQLGDLQEVHPDGWADMGKVYFLAVESKPLEAVRKSYGLSALPDEGKKRFHLTVARKRVGVLYENDKAKQTGSLEE